MMNQSDNILPMRANASVLPGFTRGQGQGQGQGQGRGQGRGQGQGQGQVKVDSFRCFLHKNTFLKIYGKWAQKA